MPSTGSQANDFVDWVHRVNGRWIVHHGLKESAEAYLNHLQADDPGRLMDSCARAHQLVHTWAPSEDPKPWFYAGLFSLATAREAERFLDGHWFTVWCIPTLAEKMGNGMRPEGIGPDTESKANRIREAVAALSPDRP